MNFSLWKSVEGTFEGKGIFRFFSLFNLLYIDRKYGHYHTKIFAHIYAHLVRYKRVLKNQTIRFLKIDEMLFLEIKFMDNARQFCVHMAMTNNVDAINDGIAAKLFNNTYSDFPSLADMPYRFREIDIVDYDEIFHSILEFPPSGELMKRKIRILDSRGFDVQKFYFFHQKKVEMPEKNAYSTIQIYSYATF